MKIFLLICISIYFHVFSLSQLINGDFEEYVECPTNVSQPGDFQLNKCVGWYIPTQGTSDFFHACSGGINNVPNAVFGYQEAKNGEGYVGFFANEKGASLGQCLDGTMNIYYREYIQQKLSQPLKVDSFYFVRFFISKAEKSGYASKSIGLIFSSDSIVKNCFTPIIVNPDIISSDFISDTLNWIEVSGYYQAKGNERFITIGNFRDTSQFYQDTTFVNPDKIWQDGSGYSYYYLDDVSISPLIFNNLPNVITVNGDGINDIIDFKKYLLTFSSIELINRWGDVVIELTNIDPILTGKDAKGNELLDGVYFVVAKIQNKIIAHKFIQIINN